MAEWEKEHFPPDDFAPAAANPLEIADQLSDQARAHLIAEAVERYRQDNWPQRRSVFLRTLDWCESRWFGD